MSAMVSVDNKKLTINFDYLKQIRLEDYLSRGFTFFQFISAALAEVSLHLVTGGQVLDCRMGDEGVSVPRGIGGQYSEIEDESAQIERPGIGGQYSEREDESAQIERRDEIEVMGEGPLDQPTISATHSWRGFPTKGTDMMFRKNGGVQFANGQYTALEDANLPNESLFSLWSIQSNHRIHRKEVEWFCLLIYTGRRRLTENGLRHKGCVGVLSKVKDQNITIGFGLRTKSLVALDHYLKKYCGNGGSYKFFCYNKAVAMGQLEVVERRMLVSSEVNVEVDEESEDSDSEDEVEEELVHHREVPQEVAGSEQEEYIDHGQEQAVNEPLEVFEVSDGNGVSDQDMFHEEEGEFSGDELQDRPADFMAAPLKKTGYGQDEPDYSQGWLYESVEDIEVDDVEYFGEVGSGQGVLGQDLSNGEGSQDLSYEEGSGVSNSQGVEPEQELVVHTDLPFEEAEFAVEQSNGKGGRSRMMWGEGGMIHQEWMIQEIVPGSSGDLGAESPQRRKRTRSLDQEDCGDTKKPKLNDQERALSGEHVSYLKNRHSGLVQQIGAYFYRRNRGQRTLAWSNR